VWARALLPLALLVIREPTCGEDKGKIGAEGAPCTREPDCASGSACKNGVCTVPDAGPPDAGQQASDAAADAADANR